MDINAKKRRIVWFTTAAHGHTVSIMPVIRQLCVDADLEVWTSKELSSYYEDIDVKVSHYPSSASWDFPESGLEIINATLLRANIILPNLPQRKNVDLVISDVTAIWGCAWAKKYNINHFQYAASPIGGGLGVLWPFYGPASRKSILESYKIGKENFPSIKKRLLHWRKLSGSKTGLLNIFSFDKKNIDSVTLSSTGTAPRFAAHPQQSHIGPIIDLARSEGQTIHKDNRPLVYVSLGTLYTSDTIYGDLIEAAKGISVNMVLSHPEGRKVYSGELPENVEVYSFINQLDVLKKTDLFITHAGLNSLHEALYFNTRILTHPKGADQPYLSDQIEKSGIGSRLVYGSIAELQSVIIQTLEKEHKLCALSEKLKKESRLSVDRFLSQIHEASNQCEQKKT